MNLLEYFRVAPLAKRLGLDRDEIMAAVKSGTIPHKQSGCGVVLVNEVDVAKWKLAKIKSKSRIKEARREIAEWRAKRGMETTR